ncbi:MAG: hypothetical protein BMS9Abin07_0768 [Acidimicrobiia bacterium]|nr:MAG: hypothetical protein BMS9Abin07_0768 [Acidimicrobiia bacterium]
MEPVGFAFGVLLTLLFFGGIIVLLVLLLRRSRVEPGGESPGTALRRFFLYLVMLIALTLAATGTAQLIASIIAPADTIVATESGVLATALAFVIVGVPVYVLLLRWIRRKLDSDPAERASIGWAAYLSVALVGSLLVSMGTGAATLLWVLQVDDYGSYRVAFLIVSAVVWFAHWRVAQRELSLTRNQAQLVVGSAAGLIFATSATVAAVGVALGAVYDQMFSTVLSAGDWWGDMRGALAFFIVGGLVWWWHWLRRYEGSAHTPLWYGYVLIFGVLGGLIMVVSALGTGLFAVVEWFFGSPEQASAAAHFEVLNSALSALIAGAGVWWYHRAVLRSRPTAKRQEGDRVYQYLIVGLGLVTAATGVIVLFTAFFHSLGPGPIAGTASSEVDTLLGAFTLLVIGAPIWWFTWSSIQRHAASDPATELASASRRIYLFLLFGLGALIAIGALITVIATTIDDVISGGLGAATIDQNAVSLALLISVGLIASYHWSVYRKDRTVLADEEPVGPIRDVVVVATSGLDVAAIAEATGAHIRVVERLDGVLVDAEAVITALQATEGERVLVVTTGSGDVDVIPVGRGGK